jgi:hypothetical protein
MTTDSPTEEQIARDKAQVEKMRGAAGAMQSALNRIDTLERALKLASAQITNFKGYVGGSAHCYPISGQGPRLIHAQMDDAIASISKALSA